MQNKLTIEGRLPGLNEYTNICRTNPYAANSMKQKNQEMIGWYIKKDKLSPVENYPCQIEINWYEKNQRRDVDNIIFGQKFILDALVKNGILIDDSQKYINEITHKISLDKEKPRIEVFIKC